MLLRIKECVYNLSDTQQYFCVLPNSLCLVEGTLDGDLIFIPRRTLHVSSQLLGRRMVDRCFVCRTIHLEGLLSKFPLSLVESMILNVSNTYDITVIRCPPAGPPTGALPR